MLLPLTLLVAPPLLSLSTSDGLICDVSLMIENETLKKEVNELTHALGKKSNSEDLKH
jgi:hypothetical protein